MVNNNNIKYCSVWQFQNHKTKISASWLTSKQLLTSVLLLLLLILVFKWSKIWLLSTGFKLFVFIAFVNIEINNICENAPICLHSTLINRSIICSVDFVFFLKSTHTGKPSSLAWATKKFPFFGWSCGWKGECQIQRSLLWTSHIISEVSYLADVGNNQRLVSSGVSSFTYKTLEETKVTHHWYHWNISSFQLNSAYLFPPCIALWDNSVIQLMIWDFLVY